MAPGAVVRLNRRQHGWTYPQLLPISAEWTSDGKAKSKVKVTRNIHFWNIVAGFIIVTAREESERGERERERERERRREREGERRREGERERRERRERGERERGEREEREGGERERRERGDAGLRLAMFRRKAG